MTRLRSDDAHDSWEISIPSGSIGSLSQSFLALGLTCHCRPKLSCQLRSESREIVSTETIEKYFHSLWREQPDFLYSVSRELISNCRTPILVLPDDTPSHPLPTSIDVASLAPNAEITVFPWREAPELKARTINRVRTFLKSHIPMRSAAQ
jgi:hypothetical protein